MPIAGLGPVGVPLITTSSMTLAAVWMAFHPEALGSVTVR